MSCMPLFLQNLTKTKSHAKPCHAHVSMFSNSRNHVGMACLHGPKSAIPNYLWVTMYVKKSLQFVYSGL